MNLDSWIGLIATALLLLYLIYTLLRPEQF